MTHQFINKEAGTYSNLLAGYNFDQFSLSWQLCCSVTGIFLATLLDIPTLFFIDHFFQTLWALIVFLGLCQ